MIHYFNAVWESLEKYGYSIDSMLLQALHHDVAHDRLRLFIQAVRKDIATPPAWPTPKLDIDHLRLRNQIPGVDAFSNDVFRKSKKRKSANGWLCTITANQNIWFHSGTVQRRPTTSELMQLASFPHGFKWPEPRSRAKEWARIGNSVPPKLAYHIASA